MVKILGGALWQRNNSFTVSMTAPPTPILILAGAQHVLTLFGATTLVPLIFGPAMGMTTQQIGAFIGCVYFSMGLATLIQTHPKFGSGLPIVQGSSFQLHSSYNDYNRCIQGSWA